MREIEFRAMTIPPVDEKSIWVYGSLDNSLNNDRSDPIIRCHDLTLSYGSRFVKPETIGQYTGLKDRNGVKIFEGDVVNVEYNYIGEKVVRFGAGRFNISDYANRECSVIGNIHEKAKENG